MARLFDEGPTPMDSSPDRYSGIFILLHWVIASALVVVFGSVFAKEYFDLEALEPVLLLQHKTLGLCVLMFAFLRLLLRFAGMHGLVDHSLTPAMQRMAWLTHAGIYAFMLAEPLLGWAKTSALGKKLYFLGVELPPLMAKNRTLADTLDTLHSFGGYLFLALILAHAGAALWHRLWLKDNVLYSMIPLRCLRGGVSPLKRGCIE